MKERYYKVLPVRFVRLCGGTKAVKIHNTQAVAGCHKQVIKESCNIVNTRWMNSSNGYFYIFSGCIFSAR